MPAPLGTAYWRLWGSSGLSNLADGIVKLALPLVAIQYTRSPALIAGLGFAMTLPWLVFALQAGAIADRVDRRRAMLVANTVRVLVLGLLVATLALDIGSLPLLYIAGFAIGMAETLYDTSAQSIVPQMVAPDQLSRANGRLYAVELTANQFVGPPLAGLLLPIGTAVAVLVPGGLWLLALVVLAWVPGSFRVVREGPRTTLRADIAEGLRFLWARPVLRALALMVGAFNFTTNAAFTLMVLYAVGPDSPMRLTESAYGLLLTTLAIGSLAGSLVAEHVERLLGRGRALVVALLFGILMLAVPGFTTNPWVIAGCWFLGGFGVVIWNVITVSLRQRITPARLLGRLNSAYRLFAWGPMSVGTVVGGLLAQWFGIRSVFLIMAGSLLLATLAVVRVVNERTITAAEEQGPDQPTK
ncbi:MFS transporter [Nakamurella sp. YIM 132087]|uniref:MFS transporter n=1 Tax=Nakamurella alba TaxID=2665158 RepID=A0A7K1FL20_9ACTN|nr:MFS transporter [Nakamurella alba]MTD14796.1 MFS transporter [Nakamurella alba]